MRWLLLALLTAAPAAAQETVPDTTAPWRYYPLAVGDTWHYDVAIHRYHVCSPCRYNEVRDVVDTAGVEGRTYAVIQTRTLNVPANMPGGPPPPIPDAYVRFDTAAATPMAWSSGQEHPVDYRGCRLDEPFPALPDSSRVITCLSDWGSEWLEPTVRGGYDLPLPLGGTATQKAFRYVVGFGAYDVTYAAGIGPLAMGGYWEIEMGEFRTLRYARVGGVTYGAPIVTAEPAADRSSLTVAVSPNPVRGAAEVALTLREAGAVQVAVYDVLGREVARLAEGDLPAGAHTFALPASGLRPGAYVVRAGAGGAAVTARVVVAR